MMDELCNLLGKSLHSKVMAKLDGKELYLSDGKLIPKYRLDEISTALKRQKLICSNLRTMLDMQANQYLEIIDDLKINCMILKAVSKSKPKNFDSVLRLINKKKISIPNAENSIKYQIRKIKRNFPQLFYEK